ncbi:MAG: bifunctional aldolase/short-chain dehydrogenase, partial [Mesorhizobium amorphae]
MQNLWRDEDAEAIVAAYASKGVNRDLALRTYTTRLLGGDPHLVLHGGGNTSVKTTAQDLFGDTHDVLCVKGSGWDMGTIEPPGLPAVKLAPLLRSREFTKLSDEDMVALLRANLIDITSPNPSVEALLHAFLPHKFVDHTHSTAILALVDQENSEEICRAVFGKRMGFVPYIMPGFALAKASAEVFERDPSVEGLILDKHGIFTFGETAEEAYGRMIEFVTIAEDHVKTNGRKAFTPATLPETLAKPADIAPMLRGAVAFPRGEGRFDRMVSVFRTSADVLAFVNSTEVEEMAARGVSTPDLSIRIKTGPMVLPAPVAGELAGYRATIDARVAEFVEKYTRYFQDNDARDDVKRTDPLRQSLRRCQQLGEAAVSDAGCLATWAENRD